MATKSLLKRSRMLKSGTKKAPPPIPAAVATEPICTVLTVLVNLYAWLEAGCQNLETHVYSTVFKIMSECSSPAQTISALRYFCHSHLTSACAYLLWHPLQLCTHYCVCRQQKIFGKLTCSHVRHLLSSIKHCADTRLYCGSAKSGGA